MAWKWACPRWCRLMATNEPATGAPGEWAGNAALVTGAGGGIGRMVVAALLAEGSTVGAFDAAAEPLESARAIWDAGERVQTVVGDVGDADQVAAAFTAAERTGCPLTALAACAGIYPQAELTSTTDAEWQRVQRINLRGVFLSCQAAARAMVPHRAGAMVTMSSGLGFTGASERAAYAASKA